MPRQKDATAPDLLNDSFRALSHPLRRRILTRIHDHNPREENEFSRDSMIPDGEGGERVLIDIHHRHLPSLEESGFLTWDREADVIRRGPRFEEIAPLIELMKNHEDELPAGWP